METEGRFFIELNTSDHGMPCPLNAYYQAVRCGKAFTKIGKSKRGRTARDTVMEQIKQAWGRSEPMIGQVACSVRFQASTRTQNEPDVDAYLKCVLDAIEDAGVVSSDGQITQLTVTKDVGRTKGGYFSIELWEI